MNVSCLSLWDGGGAAPANCSKKSCTSNGTTTLTVADSSVFSFGDVIEPNTTLGLSASEFNYHYVTATPTSTTVTLNAAATASATANATFIVKRENEIHNNAIF